MDTCLAATPGSGNLPLKAPDPPEARRRARRYPRPHLLTVPTAPCRTEVPEPRQTLAQSARAGGYRPLDPLPVAAPCDRRSAYPSAPRAYGSAPLPVRLRAIRVHGEYASPSAPPTAPLPVRLARAGQGVRR
jgi:hypothetical protein